MNWVLNIFYKIDWEMLSYFTVVTIAVVGFVAWLWRRAARSWYFQIIESFKAICHKIGRSLRLGVLRIRFRLTVRFANHARLLQFAQHVFHTVSEAQTDKVRRSLAQGLAYFDELDNAVAIDPHGAADGLYLRGNLEGAIALVSERSVSDRYSTAYLVQLKEFTRLRDKLISSPEDQLRHPRDAPLILSIVEAVVAEHPHFSCPAELQDVATYFAQEPRNALVVLDVNTERLRTLRRIGRSVREAGHLVEVLSNMAVLAKIVQEPRPNFILLTQLHLIIWISQNQSYV